MSSCAVIFVGFDLDVHWPGVGWCPTEGWWIMIRLWGRAQPRCPWCGGQEKGAHARRQTDANCDQPPI